MTNYEPLREKAFAQHDYDDEIDLRQLFVTLWAGKWLILAMTIVFTAGGVAYALSKPNIYQSSVLLAPAIDHLAEEVRVRNTQSLPRFVFLLLLHRAVGAEVRGEERRGQQVLRLCQCCR